MACNISATSLGLPLLVLMLMATAGALSDASKLSPPMARRAGPMPTAAHDPAVAPATSTVVAEDCPLIQVPSLVDACRSPPGLRACAAQCIVYHYRGEHCDVLRDGRLGDCTCMNCLGIARCSRRPAGVDICNVVDSLSPPVGR